MAGSGATSHARPAPDRLPQTGSPKSTPASYGLRRRPDPSKATSDFEGNAPASASSPLVGPDISSISDAALPSASTSLSRPGTPSRRGHEFRPRRSHFDRENFQSRTDLHGFWNLGIIAALFYVLVTVTRTYRRGFTVHLRLLETMGQDLVMLGLADMAIVLFTFTAYVFQRAIVAGWIRGFFMRLLHHVLLSSLFALAAFFIFTRDWPWPQSGTLMMHAITLYMKMHSYIVTNRELAAHADAQPAEAKVRYPNNVTLRNYADFLMVPTLVYEPEYPRTDKVRPSYLLEKAILGVGAISLLFLTVSHHILPVLEDMATMTILESVVLLIFPFMLAYLLVFYIIFECVCNFVAEATQFADREFYGDWWNRAVGPFHVKTVPRTISLSFDEFSRKWNRPVHEFLLRHVYLETMVTYKVSKLNATAATLVFSLLLHELALTAAGRRFRPYIMVMALFQLPLMPLMRHPLVRRSGLGNLLFWAGMLLGIPMLCVLYARESYDLPGIELNVLGTFLGTCFTFVGLLALINAIGQRRSAASAALKDAADCAVPGSAALAQ